MAKTVFRLWDPDQVTLFPAAFRDLMPKEHLVHFVREVVTTQLDLTAGFRRFLHRGLVKVRAEWRRICVAHNLLKLAAVQIPATA